MKKRFKILLDMNISPDIAGVFDPKFFEIVRALEFFPQDADDADIYRFAWEKGYDAVIVRDSDFKALMESALEDIRAGQAAKMPPRLIRIKDGQMKKEQLVRLIDMFRPRIAELLVRDNKEAAFCPHYLCIKVENLPAAQQQEFQSANENSASKKPSDRTHYPNRRFRPH